MINPNKLFIPLQLPKIEGANCIDCPLFDQPFVAPWNVEAGEILFVGEAPGVQEVLEGVPFVGQSGMLLDRIISTAGYDPFKVAKTNACLCRPHRLADGSVTPPLEALEACQGALSAIVRQFPGQTIVALGKHATQALDAIEGIDNQAPISTRRGVWETLEIEPPTVINTTFDIAQILDMQYTPTKNDTFVKPPVLKYYLPTLHPAFVLRSPGYIQKLIDDIVKAYQGPFQKHQLLNTTYNVVETFEDVKEMIMILRSSGDTTFDIETQYLQWFDSTSKSGANVLCLVFACSINNAYIVPDTTLAQPRVLEFLQILFDQKAFIMHNGKFDKTVTLAKLGLNVQIQDDTMLMDYTIHEGNSGHGLKELSAENFQAPDYEEELLVPIFKEHKMNRDNRDYSVIPREILYQYAAIDACATLMLHDVLQTKLESEGQYDWPYRNILVRADNALAQVEFNGIMIDRPYLEKVNNLVERDKAGLIVRMRAFIEDKTDLSKFPRLVKLMADDGFNPGSPDQVSIIIYQVLGLKLHRQPMEKTATQTGKECLKILNERYKDHEFLKMLTEYRRVEKIRSTYTSVLLRIADTNDIVHVNFLIHGTEVGRLSASDSLHGIPNAEDDDVPPLKRYGAMIRGSFIAPEGHVLIIADYSQAEMRAFADETQDPYLLEIYRNGLDLHEETTKMIAKPMGLDYDTICKPENASQKKNVRRLAKNIEFGGLVYGGGAHAISALTGVAEPIVKQVQDFFYAKLAVARQWQLDLFRLVKRQGFVRNRFGFKRRFVLQTGANIDNIRKDCVHAMIACDASYLTIMSVCDAVENNVNVGHTVHDSIISTAKIEDAETVATFMETRMQLNGEKWFSSIPWKADIERNKDGSFPTCWYQDRPNLDEVS